MSVEKYVPSSLADWEAWLSEHPAHVNEWNGYAGECEEIVLAVLDRFRGDFEGTPGIERISHGVYHNGDWVIHVEHRFIFDPTTIPETYMGVQVRRSTVDLPREFQVGPGECYAWAPEHYAAFAERAAREVRSVLDRPGMSVDEILDYLSPSPTFGEWVETCADWRREGAIRECRCAQE